MHDLNWPERLWIARHGQSAGNVARDAAEAAGLALIDLAARDIDVPLSALGERQAVALGEWFGAAAEADRPTAVLCSPYVRARETARLLMEAGGLRPSCGVHVDERLREKEFGILDRLTAHGIRERHPELSTQRTHVGKFYFRPPGGESWCDVILRLRSLVDTLKLEFRGERVLVVAHQVTVNCFRYLLEKLDERQILEIDRAADVPNCGVTEYRLDPSVGALALVGANFTAPLREAGEPVTREPDVPAAPKS
ncbi:MAG TPA: histidine phosphatase family protein [Burkholderiaceae bacterium]|nr:histidine phosphatase family protein [Burkholderiaceae bacterium]